MSNWVAIDEAQAKLREIIAGLRPDEEVVITENNHPIAKLVGAGQPSPERPGPGLCQGMIAIVADDDEHLEDFREYMP